MTTIRAINQFENQATFELLAQAEFNPDEKYAKVDGITLDLTESEDDVVMLNGDNITVNAKEGNNTVYLSGSNNVVTAGDGTNQVALWGKDSSVLTGKGNDFMYLEGENLSAVSLGGNNIFRIYGDNNFAAAQNGNNEIGILGSGNTVYFENGTNHAAYYGNNNIIKGVTTAKTIDYALQDRKFTDMEDRWVESLNYQNSSEKVPVNTVYDFSTCTNEYVMALSDAERQYAASVDLSEMVDDKYPKYIIALDDNGYARLYKYSYVYNNTAQYYPIGEEAVTSSKKSFSSTQAQEVSYDEYEYYTMIYSKNYEVDGVSGNYVEFVNGDNELKQTLADGTNDESFGEANYGHTLNQQTAYTFAEQEKRNFTNYQRKTQIVYVYSAE